MKIEIINPYIGPKPFQAQDKDKFFGRDEEAAKFLSMIFANKIVILSAQSGAGKSSLLNARMVELLKNENFEIFKIQGLSSYVDSDITPENVFVYNSVLALLENGKAKKDLKNLKLSSCLEHIDPQLSEHRFVIIIDQFEEIFTSHLDRWNDRQEFLKQIQEICDNYSKSRIIFAIREDFLGRFGSISNVLKQSPYNFHIEFLNKEKALSAIKRPVEKTIRHYEEGVAEKIVEELLRIKIESQYWGGNGKKLEKESSEIEGEFVEPVQLQIVCKALWESLKPEDQKITTTHLSKIGGVKKVLEDYYETALEIAITNYPEKEKSVRDWFERELITVVGTRGNFLYSKIESEGIPLPIIDSLLESYLIRTEEHAGARWISLSHDRFIEPIRESNHRWEINRLKREQEDQQQKIKRFKKRIYSFTFLGIAFLVPLLAFGYFWLTSLKTSLQEKAFRQLYEGKQYFKEEKYIPAKNSFMNSLKNQEIVEASFYLAKTLNKLNDPEKAIEQFQKTIQLDPTYSEAYFEMGLLLVKKERFEEGYQNLIKYFEFEKNFPRTVLPPELYTDLVAYYFKSQIKSVDAIQRGDILTKAIELKHRHILYKPDGKSPEEGFDNFGFIEYILQDANVLKDNEKFDLKYLSRLNQTMTPQPMDLMIFPGINNTILFYLGDFFDEKLCIGIGLTAFVDIINFDKVNYAKTFYRIPYRK